MKWLSPKKFLIAAFGTWMLLLAAYILIVEIVDALIRYWYIAVFVVALIIGIWVLLRQIRRRLDRW